jgi:hypothetical protein
VWADHPGVPESENAWALLEEVGTIVQAIRDEARATTGENRDLVFLTYDAIYLPTSELRRQNYLTDHPTLDDAAQHELFKKAAMEGFTKLRERGVIERTATLSRAKVAVRPAGTGPVYEVMLPEITTVRELARAQRARMHVALEAGDEQEVVKGVYESLGLARLLTQQPFVIDRLSGINAMRDVLGGVREAPSGGRLSAETCRGVLAAIDAQVRMPPAARAVEASRIGALDTVQWTHTRGGRRVVTEVAKLQDQIVTFGSTPQREGVPLRIANAGAVLLPRKAAIEAKVNSFYDRSRDALALGWRERAAAFRALGMEIVAESAEDRYMSLVLHRVEQLGEMDELLACEREGTRVVLAIAARRAGGEPLRDTLADLSDVLMPLPSDPFAGDGAFVYRRDEGAVGGYLLYSVGPDRIDDGGKVAVRKKGERRDPTPKTGDDLVLHGRPTPEAED